jgi:hypothetical protein
VYALNSSFNPAIEGNLFVRSLEELKNKKTIFQGLRSYLNLLIIIRHGYLNTKQNCKNKQYEA